RIEQVLTLHTAPEVVKQARPQVTSINRRGRRRYAVLLLRARGVLSSSSFFGAAAEVLDDELGRAQADERLELAEARLRDALEAAEVAQQDLLALRPDAGDLLALRVAVAHLAPLAVVGDGEAVRLVADSLHA